MGPQPAPRRRRFKENHVLKRQAGPPQGQPRHIGGNCLAGGCEIRLASQRAIHQLVRTYDHPTPEPQFYPA
jgi:hypothetical protein